MTAAIELSIVVPLYNEEAGLALFMVRLQAVLNELKSTYEIIGVDDGSADNTWECLIELIKTVPALRGIRFTRNFGKEAAILAGLQAAKGQAIVVMDGDGQHPPELLAAMVAAWRQGYAVVAAQKADRPHDSLSTRFCSAAFNYLMKTITGLDLQQSTDYRLLDKRVAEILLKCPEKVRFFRGMISWTGFKTFFIPFSVPERIDGESRWNRWGLLRFAVHALVSYSAKPLFYVLATGFAGVGISFLLAIQAIYSWAADIAVSGWTSLTLVMVFFGSMNLLGVGLLGVYLAQIFDEIKQRPSYLVKDTAGSTAGLNDPVS